MKRENQENKTVESKGKGVATRPKKTTFVRPKVKDVFKHRNNIKEVLLCSNATSIRRIEDMGYMCSFCSEYFIKPAELKKHTQETHKEVLDAYFFKRISVDRFVVKLDITALRCKLCDVKIDALEGLLRHLKIEHKKRIYTDVKNHIVPFKFDTDALQCCICSKPFSKFKMLFGHMHSHYRNFVCQICDVGYVNSLGLLHHMQTHDEGVFKCEYCPEVFTTKVKRSVHEKKHTRKTSRMFKCGLCNEEFDNYRKKEKHMAVEHGQVHKCKACDKVFNNTNGLNNHVKRNHLRDKRYKCPDCEKSFYNGRELENHKVSHTGVRAYKCDVCLKAYGRKKTLAEHMKIHNDIRRFKCEHCGQAFVQKCSWKGHMRSKHGEIV